MTTFVSPVPIGYAELEHKCKECGGPMHVRADGLSGVSFECDCGAVTRPPIRSVYACTGWPVARMHSAEPDVPVDLVCGVLGGHVVFAGRP